MKHCRLALFGITQTPLDFQGNAKRLLDGIKWAQDRDADFAIFPELALTGYGVEDAFLYPHVLKRAFAALCDLASEVQETTACVGLPVMYEGSCYNGVAVLHNGEIAGIVLKRHLAYEHVYYEPRWFAPWPLHTRSYLEYEGLKIPCGDWVFSRGALQFGIEICEDAWKIPRPSAVLFPGQVDIWINCSASHFARGKHAMRKKLVKDISQAERCGYVYVNMLGNEAGRLIYDGGQLVALEGEITAHSQRFSYKSLDASLMSLSLSSPKNPPSAGHITLSYKSSSEMQERPALLALEVNEKEEVLRAVCLGLYHFFLKSGQQGFVISLSGGKDSAAVLVVVWAMLHLACKELGQAQVKENLGIPVSLNTIEEMMGHLVTTIYQRSKNSSLATEHAAAALAKEVGARHWVWEIESVVESYTVLVEEKLGRSLSWEKDDLALQNIQARVRAPGAWLVANLQNALLLTTSNRSEAAMGYCTMDGDTSGGLAPFAGISKHFLQTWLTWIAKGADGLLPVLQSLQAILALPASAELRPGGTQEDETELMPYAVLDAFETAFLGKRLDKDQAVQVVKHAFPEWEEERLMGWAEMFLTRWQRNQWKRERMAPSFHLDAFSVDPKTFLRYPIFSAPLDFIKSTLKKDES